MSVFSETLQGFYKFTNELSVQPLNSLSKISIFFSLIYFSNLSNTLIRGVDINARNNKIPYLGLEDRIQAYFVTDRGFQK